MYIGIDLGTSGVKIILVDKSGTILRTVSRNFELLIPKPSWSEQDPNDWYAKTLEGLKEIVKGYEPTIQGIGFSGQMHGLVLLDENDQVLRNAILWNDQRTVEEVKYLNDIIGIETLLLSTGNIALTGLTAPKVLWVKNNEPEIYQLISKVMLPKDYLLYRLSGVFASDVSDLSGTLYFDPKTKKYSLMMLDILGLKEENLPKIFESFDPIGTLNNEMKALLGINQDVLIIAGGGDQAVGAIGVGVLSNGECSISLGTSGVIFVASDNFAVDRKSFFQSYAHANGKYHLMAVMLNAAGAIKWWNEDINNNNDYDRYYRSVTNSKIESDLFFLPYLTGERAPINDPYAKGVLFGLENHHRKPDIDRAIVEGVTFALRDSFELIQNLGVYINQVRITGGGAKSDVWAQMIADVMNVKVVKMKAEEGPAMGAAILAMVGCKAYPNVEMACKSLVNVKQSYHPNDINVELYNEKYQKFIKLYPAFKGLFCERK